MAGAASTALVPQGDQTQQMFAMFQQHQQHQFQQFLNMQNRNQGGRGDIEITYPARKKQRALQDITDPQKSPQSAGVATPKGLEFEVDSQDVEDQPSVERQVQRRPPPVELQPPPEQRQPPQVEVQQPPLVEGTEAREDHCCPCRTKDSKANKGEGRQGRASKAKP